MEVPHVIPLRKSRQPEAAVDNVHDLEEAATNPDVETDDLVTEATQLDEKISQQEKDIESKWASIAERKAQTKQKVVVVFAELKEMLETKERETLDKVQRHFDSLRAPLLEPSVVNVTLDKTRVYTMLKNESEYVKTFSRDDVMQTLSDLKTSVMKRDQIISVNYEPNITINEDLRAIVQQGQCASECSEADVSTPEVNAGTGNSIVNVAEFHREPEQGKHFLANVEENNSVEANESENGQTENVQENNRETNTTEPECATADPSEMVQPLAPPLEPTVGSQEDPPPYWQVVGLSDPKYIAAQTSNVPSAPYFNTRTYQDTSPRYHDAAIAAPTAPSEPCNYLNVWHSFPVKHQHNSKLVLPVALTWNHGCLCLADRNNRKITFFNESGEPFAEMSFKSEIHDVAFLERCQNESRYIVNLAKSCTFCIIALKVDCSTKLVCALKSIKSYKCISKGPQDQTLVGGCGYPSIHAPSVDILDFNGHVQRSILYTPRGVPFRYPKSVHVLNQFIIISDWGLSVVCVFFGDGSPVGQYGGTPQTPLTDPADITLDHFGNIMVLDGHLPNIHVIDLKCTPIEITKLPDARGKTIKFLAFDTSTKMLAAMKNNSHVVVYSFRGGYYSVPQGSMIPELEKPELVLSPGVEGILPSTIQSMKSPSWPRGRTGEWHV